MWTRRKALIGASSAIAASAITTPARACPKTVRIIVSLADNKNQGLVPISQALGNGQNPDSNLYWGAKYGVRTFFDQHPDWKITKPASRTSIKAPVLDRIGIVSEGSYPLIHAEAWDGAYQEQAVQSFFAALDAPQDNLLIFVGHNPLMDVRLPGPYTSQKSAKFNSGRKVAVIACQSQKYFGPIIKRMGYEAYVMTEGNMAPEAYVVEGILSAWLENRSASIARQRAAEAYSKYQKIPIRNSNWLFGV